VKVAEEFVIAESPQKLWEFFEQFDQVARCVPGMEDVTVVDEDNSRVRVTQSLGPMTATFDVKMRVTARDPGRRMEFTAVGRSVRGAAGNVRANHVVRLTDEGSGSTRVLLEGDVALGGMLGSVGQKVVAKQAAVVTQAFAEALQERLGGKADVSLDPEPSPDSPAGVLPSPTPGAADHGQSRSEAPAGASTALPPVTPVPKGGRAKLVRLTMVGALALAVLLAVRRLRSR
jgi:hypothetical protein